MKIDVITVCFNSENTIRYTVESFLKQRHGEKSMWIVDGLSSDSTLEIVRTYNNQNIHIVSERDGGIYDAMNKGLRLFTGDAVGFLNSDDAFCDELALERLADGLRDADIVYGDIRMVRDHVGKELVRRWKAGPYSRSAFKLGWVPPHPAFYVRRHVVDAVGQFNLNYRIASDYDFMLRAMEGFQFRIQYVPYVIANYQLGGKSSDGLRNIIKGNLECLDSRRKTLRAPLIDLAFVVRPLRRVLQFKWSSSED